jgi:colicin import membrane protein
VCKSLAPEQFLPPAALPVTPLLPPSEAMPALINAAKEKQRELDKAAAAAAARAKALEERAKAAEERRRAAAEAQRRAELEAAAAVEAEVRDTLRRLEEDAKKAESAAAVGKFVF